MKRISVLLVALSLVLTLSACGIREKINQKAGEALAENILEDSGVEDVDIDGDEVTITGDDGTTMTVGGTQWPDSELASKVPEFTKGTIASVIETSDGVAITVDQVKSEDFKSYLEQIKNSFTQDTAEASADDSYTYIAANADGIQVSLYYASESLMISVAKPIE